MIYDISKIKKEKGNAAIHEYKYTMNVMSLSFFLYSYTY